VCAEVSMEVRVARFCVPRPLTPLTQESDWEGYLAGCASCASQSMRVRAGARGACGWR